MDPLKLGAEAEPTPIGTTSARLVFLRFPQRFTANLPF